ncbi:hypothetical protein NKR23_g9495 [Pleurostoma richardsiae]|uniref:Mediator of RNA polymerase II transcription subunit 22 n=1 Tax=Pleurostoma richardsiae TaxID=41990 RepID=A0AA38R6N2_9PEZI|nr:hypothetical protein NKR23_g9495 [Pleurostoma richardsiae]
MDRNQQAAGTNLLDREGRVIADVLQRFRNLTMLATDRITNKASTGTAAYHSMAMDLETQGMITAIEDLLALTRQLRELWVVGPLRKPGEGEREAEETIDSEVQRVTQMLNQLKEGSRQKMVKEGCGHGEYVVGRLETPPTQQQAPIAAAVSQQSTASQQA